MNRLGGALLLSTILASALIGANDSVAAATFGAEPLQDALYAAQNNNSCPAYLTTNKLAALMLTVTWAEVTGYTTTLTPSPMTLGRGDSNTVLYYLGNPTGTYRRAFWHPGLGAWQLDDSGLGKWMAGEKFGTATASATAAAAISSRYCQMKTVDYALAPWVACNSGKCASIFSSLYVAPDTLVTPTSDYSTTRWGGVAARTCRRDGEVTTFPCYYVNPASAQGYTGTWRYAVDATPPLSFPFYIYSMTTSGVTYEWRHWLRADTLYGIDIAARRTYGADSRLGLTWSQAGLCDVTTNRGACAPPPFLTVSKTGSGQGTVTSSPAGINCGTDCSEQYSVNTSVTLTASPGFGSAVTWSGCNSASGNTCVVSMTASKTVSAAFSLSAYYPLQVTKSGSGSGTVTSSPPGISCGSDCTENYVLGTNVTLTASPASGSGLTSWSGCSSVSGNNCVVAMTSSKTVTATFALTTPTERLVNGSFSSGGYGWSLSGDFWAGTTLSNYRTAPGYAAGGVDATGIPKNLATGSMSQAFSVPANATSATFTVWLNVTSEETTTTYAYDVLNVSLQDAYGNNLATICTRTNLNKQSSPTAYSSCSMSLLGYAGRSLRVNFRATTDSGLKTTFRIDDVSVMSNGN